MALVSILLLGACTSDPAPEPSRTTGTTPPTPEPSSTQAINPREELPIAFERDFRIWVMPPEGQPWRLSPDPHEGPFDFEETSPSWSPDGLYVAFDRQCTEFCPSWIWVARWDGEDLHQLTGVSSDERHGDRDPSWSPDGQQIVFSRDRTIHVMNADGSGIRPLTEGADDDVWESFPDWSPDGGKIVFIRGRALMLMNADGTGLVRLAHCRPFCSVPRWSPDGSEVLFGNIRNLAIIGRDGSDLRFLFDCPTEDCPDFAGADWSPDGSTIVYSVDEGFRDYVLYTMDAAGTGSARWFDDAAFPEWRPVA
jgi:Tol biopolymer transport system component